MTGPEATVGEWALTIIVLILLAMATMATAILWHIYRIDRAFRRRFIPHKPPGFLAITLAISASLDMPALVWYATLSLRRVIFGIDPPREYSWVGLSLLILALCSPIFLAFRIALVRYRRPEHTPPPFSDED